MGTGCVFNRTALYGYEPPLKQKHRKAGFLSSCFGGSRKKSSKSSKNGPDKKKSSKHVDSTVPIYNLEDIEEGVEGIYDYIPTVLCFFQPCYLCYCYYNCIHLGFLYLLFFVLNPNYGTGVLKSYHA